MPPTTYALLVIDMLADFFEREPTLGQQRARLVAGINALTNLMRRHGQRVIWVRQEFRPDLSDAFLNMCRERIHITIAGTAGSRILPELERDPADLEVVKKRYSAFFRTDLDHLLQDLRAGSVIVAGINTHACVRMAVIDAFQRDLDVILATECVGSYDAAHHAVTLDYLQGKMARRAARRSR